MPAATLRLQQGERAKREAVAYVPLLFVRLP
jgi:hypothetical protein